MIYGLTADGFVPKRYEDIRADLEAGYRAQFGDIDVEATSVFGQKIAVETIQLTELWEQLENIYNSRKVNNAEALSLDDLVSYTGMLRLAATASTAVAHFKGTDSMVIPVGTVVKQSSTSKEFRTLGAVTLNSDSLHRATVTIESVVIGTYALVINGVTISFETDSFGSSEADIVAGLATAINISSVNDVVVATSSDVTLTISSAQLNDAAVIFELSVDSKMSIATKYTPATVESVDLGMMQVPVNSIDAMVSSVSGVDLITNLTDGVSGRAVESDDELRVRRRTLIGSTANGTLLSIRNRILQDVSEVSSCSIYENTTGEIANSLPPHSFQVVVSAINTTDVNNRIAQIIWDLKPAGVATYGATEIEITDYNDEPHAVSFSHVETKYAHIKLVCTKTGSETVFPINGQSTIKSKIIEMTAGYTIGSDLLYQPFIAAGYQAGGVTSVVSSIDVTDAPDDTPTFVSSNISVNKDDRLSFDISRVTVEVV